MPSAISSWVGWRPSSQKLPGKFTDLVQPIHGVGWQPDHAIGVTNGPGDALTDPPVGVGAELIATLRVKPTARISPTVPSWIRSRRSCETPSGVLLAQLTTKRRLALSMRSKARWPVRQMRRCSSELFLGDVTDRDPVLNLMTQCGSLLLQ